MTNAQCVVLAIAMVPESRILLQPCFVLHQRPYRDTSVLLDLFSRDHGRLSAVARGARAERSRLRGVLQAFTPLLVSWFGRTELMTLVHAEIASPPLVFSGARIFSGLYLNELLLRLAPQADALPDLFDAYKLVLAELSVAGISEADALRRFELCLIRQLGYDVALTHDVHGDAIDPARQYGFVLERGLIPAGSARQEGVSVSGRALAVFGSGDCEDPAVLNEIRIITRAALGALLGSQPLRSRELLVAFHATKKPTESG